MSKTPRPILSGAIGAAVFLFSAGIASVHAAPCNAGLSAAIPPRAAAAPDGSAFVRSLQGLDDDAREAAIEQQLLAGNVPQFLRQLVAVQLPAPGAQKVYVCVAPDYLAVGSDEDYFLAPMRLETALYIARRFGFVLPTRKIVDAVYTQSQVQLQPQPLPAGDTMRTTAYYWRHNGLVRTQRAAAGQPLGALTAGDKKDIVLSARLWRMQDRVAIYGWHRPGGRAIQPLSTVHGWRYADYSHGARLVADTAFVDGLPEPIAAALDNVRSASLFSDDGPIPQLARLIDVLEQRGPRSGS